ncbi:MAG TPA: SpoIIE family protein phosphatase [Patescibacteria group bacterium]|nr:SpoIIE family protein phosphatase [Patescibacteria group bacterium]
MRILIADDEETNRIILSRHLKRWKYDVVQAANGQEAWEILQREHINFVITDWMMPIMTGAELVQKIRTHNFGYYIYTVLLTSQSSIAHLVEGMESGADDYVVKPFNDQELHARLRAGERILALEQKLAQQNAELTEAYSVISKDLEAASKMQKSLLPNADTTMAGFCFEWLFIPSKYVAGDILNFFKLDEEHICFYLLDVAGHGIPSAMLSVTLSKILTPNSREGDPMHQRIPHSPEYEIRKPSEVLRELNERFQTEYDAMQYFTIIYGVLETKTGRVVLSQAGHPSPLHVHQSGEVEMIGLGGFPVGMLPNMEYDDYELFLKKGDRLVIYSDGISECANEKNELFGQDRLAHLVGKYRKFPLKESVKMGEEFLRRWNASDEYDDDVTLLAIERME